MHTFKIKRPSEWEELGHGMVYTATSTAGQRVVKQTINATGPVVVKFSPNADLSTPILVGAMDAPGMMSLEVSIGSEGHFIYEMSEGVEAYVLHHTADQRRNASLEASYTSLEPQGRRNSGS